MTGIVNGIFTSLGVVFAFAAAACWVAARPQSRLARRTALAVALGYLAASIFVVPHAVGWLLFTHSYRTFEASDAGRGRTVVVLLGGGTDTAHGVGNTTLAVPSGDGLERVLEAARVFNLTHAEALIASGGTLDDRQERDAITMRDQLARLGIPPDRILVEPASRTTHEQAVLVAPMLKSLGADRVVLVTSDIHMLRSLGAFRAYGVNATPATAPSTRASDPLSVRLFPSSFGLDRSRAVSHEVFGMAYYVARGWWK